MVARASWLSENCDCTLQPIRRNATGTWDRSHYNETFDFWLKSFVRSILAELSISVSSSLGNHTSSYGSCHDGYAVHAYRKNPS